MQPDGMQALVRRHIEQGFNRGDWTVCETTLADDYTARYGAEGKANVGRDHYVRVCRMLRRSFPDVGITIEDVVVQGDKIVNRYVERGTLTGATFLGIEAAGQRYEKPGITVYRVADDRLAESWGVEEPRAGSVSSASTPIRARRRRRSRLRSSGRHRRGSGVGAKRCGRRRARRMRARPRPSTGREA
jgi:steroid delta-isomerase-like uncharacterized protein